MSDILNRIVDAKRETIRRRREERPLEELKQEVSGDRRPGRFRQALLGEGLSLIAEIKPEAPSAGRLTDLPADRVAEAYEQEGVEAVSVLTDEPFFGQGLSALETARNVLSRPVLRKDFILDSYQVYESAAAGADAILLIASILSPDEIDALRGLAGRLGLDVLVEVHTRRELKSLHTLPPLLGINNRTLEGDFDTDLGVTERLAVDVPSSTLLVSESGIETEEDLRRLAEVDAVDAVLVGTALVRDASDPATIRERIRRLTSGARGATGS